MYWRNSKCTGNWDIICLYCKLLPPLMEQPLMGLLEGCISSDVRESAQGIPFWDKYLVYHKHDLIMQL